MTTRVDIIGKLKLWPHQRAAVSFCRTYLKAHRNNTTQKSALVQMPTGSGKSGVIAVVARCLPEVGLTLLLTPRVSLRDQLAKDVAGRFFDHIGFPTDQVDKSVTVVQEGDVPDLSGDAKKAVIVTTIQKLVSIKRNNSAVYKQLCKTVSLIVVDEGHYEPAKEWSAVIRGISAPKIIFTATPYRNDFKVFDVDVNHVHVYAHAQAVADRYLRNVQIIDRPFAADPQSFIKDVVQFYDQRFGGVRPEPRVIIRCDNAASIRQLANELHSRGKSVVAIHEVFRETGGEPWERKRVPPPELTDAVFWIHQFKLLEGIDDRRFQVLAMYEHLNNARSFVQQVGRVIRNPDRQANAVASVLDHWQGLHREMWNGFLKYDHRCMSAGFKNILMSTGKGIAEAVMRDQPKLAYLDGRFRTEFDFSAVNPYEDIEMPLRVTLFRKLSGFSLDLFKDELSELYDDDDRAYKQYSPAPDVRVLLSISCSQSRYLRNHCFLECDLHVAIAREFRDYVAICETSGMLPRKLEDMGLGSPDIKKLRSLFAGGSRARLTSVCLKNSNLGASVIRSKSITAVSIQATIPATDDHAQICTTAEGYSYETRPSLTPAEEARERRMGGTGGLVRRYVGFSRGRISDPGTDCCKLSDYLRWTEHINDTVSQAASGIKVLSRFATESEVPSEPAPRSLLIDIEDVRGMYLLRESNEPLDLQDTCVDVENGRFEIEVAGNGVQGEISFNPNSNRYKIVCPKLDQACFTRNRELLPGIVDYLNRQQSFRVLPESWRTVYVNGHFYRPGLRVGSNFDKTSYELGHCFVTDQELESIRSEKGAAPLPGGAGWQRDCLFGLIDTLGAASASAQLYGSPDLMVCDDLGREAADFILCETRPTAPRVIFIHAKASPESHDCAASELHVVCSQAVKNLPYLAMFSGERPAKVGSWNGSWKDPDIGEVKKRIRRGANDGAALWDRVRETINNPMVNKEVWLFLGSILSQKAFEKKLGQPKPPAEALQAAYLLHSTMSEVASVGAKLRIFCSP